MKNLKLIIGPFLVIFTIMACRNTENEQRYESVDAYESYVDSISNVGMQDVSDRWDEIENTVRQRRNEAESQLRSIEDQNELKNRYEQKIYSTTERYDDFRRNVLEERERTQATNATQNLRNSLFKNANVGDNRNFDWVNKDNILATYDHFVTTVTNNKDNYTRAEWDEIKMLYEALDTRKNTVENEGLSAEDNRKIAALKVKFSPMYHVNRLDAKTEENKESKNN